MQEIYRKAAGAARFIRQQLGDTGTLCVITGSGLDNILDGYRIIASLPFSRIPHLNEATFHRGEFRVLESSEGFRFSALIGRLHYYEGYSAREVGFPIRILKLLGHKALVMSNAAGGLNPAYNPADIIMVRDHINLLPDNPLRGPNDERFGVRFPDMTNAYDKSVRLRVEEYAKTHGIALKQGVYVAFQGPSLETPSEYLFLNRMGGDLVGMSTVPEVITAIHCSMRVLLFSVVTNVSIPVERIKPTTVEHVIGVAHEATPKLSRLIKAVIGEKLMFDSV